MRLRFFPTDINYEVVEGRPIIYVYGRSEKDRVCIIDRNFRPYVLARIEDADFSALLGIGDEEHRVTGYEPVEMRWLGQPHKFLRIYFNVPKAVPALRELVAAIPGILELHEYDILFTRRYLIDKRLTPMTLVEAECTPSDVEMPVPCYEVEFWKPLDKPFESPRVLAVDIEVYNPEGKVVDAKRHPVVMISLFGDGIETCLTWKAFSTDDGTIEFLNSEKEMLLRFVEHVKDFAPDLLAGYFSDVFDFPYLVKRARKLGVDLDIGLDGSEMIVRGRNIITSEVKGVPHIDVCKFVQRVVGKSMQTDTYTLDAVAEELLGEHKHEVPIERLAEEWDKAGDMLEAFCKYCLHDSRLTHQLALTLLPNMVELVKLIGLPVFDVTRMSFSQFVEWFIIRQASLAGEACPNKPGREEELERMHERAKGAFVFEPTPGLYENIVVFDYRSLYPSIIASHNISNDTLRCKCCKKEGAVPGMKYWFCKKEKGFLSRIIEEILLTRGKLKDALKEDKEDKLLQARVKALKDLANSFYGYLGFAPARWYCFECQESITAWGRHHIQKVISQAEDAGFEVLYGDTDSCFFLLGKKSKQDAQEFVDRINEDLPGMMELEYENFYVSGLFVSTKSGAGAKKRYAMLSDNGKFKITGFETVRRNVSPIAKQVQRRVLEILLREKDVEKAKKYVQGVIDRLKAHEVEVEDVTIYTKLQKKISSYAAIGPHVAAAKRMEDKGIHVVPGSPLHYVVTKGKGRIRDKVRLPGEVTKRDYDPEYYVHNQVLPAVERLFSVFRISEQDLESKQKKLGSFE